MPSRSKIRRTDFSTTAGGDPGTPDLMGAPTLDRARKPIRVIRLETAGWTGTTDATKTAFEDYLRTLSDQGVEIVDRSSDSGVEALEQALKRIPELLPGLLGFEAKWPMADYETSSPGVLGEKMQRMLKSGREVSIEQYRELLNIRADIRASQVRTCDIFVLLRKTHHPTNLKSAIRFTAMCLRPLGHPRSYCPSSQSKVCRLVSNAWGGPETTSH